MAPEDANNKALIVVDNEDVPETLSILPVERQVAFPGLNMTLAVNTNSLAVIEAETKKNRMIGVMGIKQWSDNLPPREQTQKAGTAARILYVTQKAEDQALMVVHGVKRFRVKRWLEDEPYLRAEVTAAPEHVEADIETEALYRSLRNLTQEVFSMSLSIPKEAIEGLNRIKSPLALGYIAAAHADIDFEKKQQLLEEDSLKVKLRLLV